MTTYEIKGKGTVLHINGHTYWGNRASLKGWEPQIGSFYILATAPDFKRYIAHQPFTMALMEQHYEKIAELARKYDAEPTKILHTHGKYYTFEKYINVFFLGQKCWRQKDLDTIQRVLNEGKLNKEILFNVEIKLGRNKTDTSVVTDIKEPLKKVHAELFKSLDSILFSK